MTKILISFLCVLLWVVAASASDLNEALLTAAKRGETETVKNLLAKGADVNAKTRYGATALSYAAERGHLEIVQVLLDKGADVNVRDTFYNATPITWATQKGHVEIVTLLLAKGASDKDQALLMAIGGGQAEIVKAFLAQGGLKPETLNTALGRALRQNKTELAELLKQAGAVPPPKADFQVAPDTLKKYVGAYRNQERDALIALTLKENKLAATFNNQSSFTLGAFDPVTFTALEFEGVTIIFNLENEQVVSLNFKQGSGNLLFKKVIEK